MTGDLQPNYLLTSHILFSGLVKERLIELRVEVVFVFFPKRWMLSLWTTLFPEDCLPNFLLECCIFQLIIIVLDVIMFSTAWIPLLRLKCVIDYSLSLKFRLLEFFWLARIHWLIEIVWIVFLGNPVFLRDCYGRQRLSSRVQNIHMLLIFLRHIIILFNAFSQYCIKCQNTFFSIV